MEAAQTQKVANVVNEFVLERAAKHPNETALITAADGTKTTRADLAESTGRAAAALVHLGVKPEQRVMLILTDTPTFLAFFWGAIWIGAVPVAASTMLTSDDYAFLLRDSRATTVIVSEVFRDVITAALVDQPHVDRAVIDGDEASPPFETVATVLTGAGTTPDVFPATEDDVAFWLYTSGTTGFPKGAKRRHADLPFLTDVYARRILDMRETDVVLSVPKLFFAYGLGNSGFLPAGTGAATVLHPGRPVPEEIAELVRRYKVTLFFGVPTFYAQLLSSEVPGDAFSTVRIGISAGEPLPEEIYNRFLERFGVELLDGIGTTELGHIFISQRLGEHRPGATGFPVDGFDIEVRDPEGNIAPRGEAGALWVGGESVTVGYWNRTARNRAALHGRFMKTGDTYVHNEDGTLTYLGRDDDMLKVGGIWVSPSEVEACIIEMEDVLMVAVVGAPDDEGMIKPRAFVIPEPGAATDQQPERVKEHVRSRLAPFKYPRWVDIVDELPLTSTGKVKRYLLRQREHQT
ncbi:MAG: benzoate-CoA ligase family protein [Acidimicrobiia bacterium]